MAWTTPRTWTTGELVTAAMMNEQLRDNENYLKDAVANTTTGHDHDGSDSKLIAWTNMPAATFTTWIGLGQHVDQSYEGGSSRGHLNGYVEGPYSQDVEMIFAFPIPYQWCGQTVHIKTITFYGYTSSNSYYFDAIYLRRSDLTQTAGTGNVTNDISYTTDIGNGTSGDTGAVVIYNSDLTLSNFPYFIVIKCASTTGGGTYADWRIYGFKVTWEA